jgi:hypothetical protein
MNIYSLEGGEEFTKIQGKGETIPCDEERVYCPELDPRNQKRFYFFVSLQKK